jgi:hypothetical protein
MAEELSNTLKVIALMVAFAGLMATICFGLCVLLLNVVDKLWPSEGFRKSDNASKCVQRRSDETPVKLFRKHPENMSPKPGE